MAINENIPLLQQALTLDRAGKTSLAIPLYRKAISQGLPNPDLHTALLSLASSLHTTHQILPAIRTLQKARKLFPRDPAITLFLALAHHANNQPQLALRQLADTLLHESPNPLLTPFKKILKQKYHALRSPPKHATP